MNPLFSSRKFALTSLEKGGNNKKEQYGILRFQGMPSMYGKEYEVLALEDGVVVEAGRIYDNTRKRMLGVHVIVSGRGGVNITYARLADCRVKAGDNVKAGDVIGIQKQNNSVMVEFRLHNRRIDGCRYLGISPIEQVFIPKFGDAEEMVCDMLGIDNNMREHINTHPNSYEFWQAIKNKLEQVTGK